MPAVPNWAEAWALVRDNADPHIILATVEHATFETLYMANNPVDIASRGLTFIASAFQVALVNDDGKSPRASFRFPNIDPILGRRIAGAVDPIEVTLEVVSAANPDAPLESAPRLQMMNVSIAPDFISGDLMGRDWSAEPVGTIVVTPTRFPALFRRR